MDDCSGHVTGTWSSRDAAIRCTEGDAVTFAPEVTSGAAVVALEPHALRRTAQTTRRIAATVLNLD
jgi:hypothetical protein